jgi:hypothetical protein
MSHLPKIILGISRQAALNPPCLPAENTLVFGSSSRRMDYLPRIGAEEVPLRPRYPHQSLTGPSPEQGELKTDHGPLPIAIGPRSAVWRSPVRGWPVYSNRRPYDVSQSPSGVTCGSPAVRSRPWPADRSPLTRFGIKVAPPGCYRLRYPGGIPSVSPYPEGIPSLSPGLRGSASSTTRDKRPRWL